MAVRKRRIVVRDRKKTAFRIAVVILALIVIAGASVLTAFTVKSCGEQLVTRTLPLISSDLICGTGDGVMYVRAGSLNFYSFKDEDLNFARPLSAVPKGLVGNSAIKAVYSENVIQIVDAPFDIAPSGEIEAVRIGAAHVAVCTASESGGESLTVYNSTGQPVYSLDYPAGRLMKFGFSEASGSTLWTMELDTDSGTPRTTITTFDLSRVSSTGVITVSGQLVDDIFFTSSSVFVIGTESLIRYSASANREIYRVQLYGYKVVDRSIAGESPLLLLLPRTVSGVKDAPFIRLLTVSQKDVAEESAVTVTLPDELVDCHLVGGQLVIVTGSSVRLCSSKGKLIESFATPVGVTVSSAKLDERHILMERSGEFDLLTVGK